MLVALLAAIAFHALTSNDSGASTNAGPSPAASAKTAPKRYHHAQAGTQVFFFKPLYADKPRCSFEFETLQSGAVRFIDAYDHREYCMTQPFEMKERPLPESAVKDAPANMPEKERAMNEPLKYYLVTSYATVKGYRYSTFRYAIDSNGTLHFDQRGSRLAIPPPYIIEENFVGKGNHPKIPDYPPSPDRG
jgi:hypothetical protein